MKIEQANGDWIGVLFIVGAIVVNLLNAMRKGKPPTAPEPRPPRPPQAQVPRREPPPVWHPEPVVVPAPIQRRTEVPAAIPLPVQSVPAPAPTPVAIDPDAADLHNLLDRLRRSDALRDRVASSEKDQRTESMNVGTAVTVQAATAGTLRLQSVLRDRNEARRAILLAEVLQPPVALRDSPR